MTPEKIEKLKHFMSLVKKGVSQQELQQFLHLVLSITKETKDSFDTISKENLQKIEDALTDIQIFHNKTLSDIDVKTNDLLEQAQEQIVLLKKEIAKVKAIKTKPGKDGKDADESRIIKKVLKSIKIPEPIQPQELEAVDIVDMLESLTNEDRLDWSAIKNTPAILNRGAGVRYLQYLPDVKITDIQNDDVLKWNSTTRRFENGTGGAAGLVDGDYGDITVSGTGTVMTIDNLAVTNAKIATGLDAVKIADGSVTNAEFQYLGGVTSDIQTQLNTKAPSTSPTFATSITGSYLTASEILITDGSKNIVSAAVATYPSLTELTYVKGVTSAIQTQLNTKIDAIGDTVTSGTTGAILHVGAGPVLAQTGATVYLSSDNFYFDQTGTGASQPTKALYFKPTYSDGTVRTTFGVYAKGLGSNSYPEMIIGGTGATEAKIRIRSLTGAGETIYFHATDVDFSNVSGPIYLKKLYLASPGESPHATEKLFLRSTANIIGAGFEIAHYGSTPQEIVYIHNNPWTGASSGGAMYTIRLRSDTTDWNLAANWTATWATATHASRKGRATFNVYDTAIREAIRIEASGSAAMVGFYGSAAVVQAANTTDLGTVLSDVGLRASGTAYPITTSGAVSFTGTIGLGGQITISDAIDIALNTTTGTKIGTATNQKLGFYNKAPVVQPTALTTQLTSITHTAPGTPDYAIQDLVDSSGGAAFGFATKDEGNTVLSVILNLQTRVSELETKLQSLGLLA